MVEVSWTQILLIFDYSAIRRFFIAKQNKLSDSKFLRNRSVCLKMCFVGQNSKQIWLRK